MTAQSWRAGHLADMCGKTVLITGATGSLGRQIARDLLMLGAHILIAARNPSKAEACKNELQSEFPSARIDVFLLDISSFSSIDSFAELIYRQFDHLDVLMQNAGIYRNPIHDSDDGIEIHMATNTAGPLYLIMRLLPLLHRSENARVVCMGSLVTEFARLDPNDLQSRNCKNATLTYARTKRLFAFAMLHLGALARTVYPNVGFTLVHPGVSATTLFAAEHGGFSAAFNRYLMPVMRVIFMSPEKACLSAVYACTHAVACDAYVGPRGFMRAYGYPAVRRLRRQMFDPILRARCYVAFCDMIGASRIPAAFCEPRQF